MADRPPAYVGVDPGRTGACVVLDHDGCTVLDLLRWRRTADPPALPVVAGDVLALEAAYVGRSPRGSMSLQLWRGKLLGALPAGVVVTQPLARTWRPKVLRHGAGTLRRPEAKALAIQAATLHARGLAVEWDGDSAEAWCLARWAWAWDRAGVE